MGKTQGELGRDNKKVKYWEVRLEKTFVTGKTETLEYYISSQGKKHYFNTKIVLELADGKVISVLSISRDITDIKETEAKLKETLDNLENLVEERTTELETAYKSLKEKEESLDEAQQMAYLGNWERNLVTGEVYWSDEMYRIYERNPQEPVTNFAGFFNYAHPDDRDYLINGIKAALNGKPFSIDHRVILANGDEHTVHSKGEVILDKENNPVRIRGTVQDITERKKSEEKLQESEEKYRNIVETANEGIVIINIRAIITYVNQKMMDLQDIVWKKALEDLYGTLLAKNL
jgi:PAS domain-containing protein